MVISQEFGNSVVVKHDGTIVTPSYIGTYGPRSKKGPVWKKLSPGMIILNEEGKSYKAGVFNGDKITRIPEVDAFHIWNIVKEKHGTNVVLELLEKCPISYAQKAINRISRYFPGVDLGTNVIIVSDASKLPPESDTVKRVTGKGGWLAAVNHWKGESKYSLCCYKKFHGVKDQMADLI